VNVGDDAVLRYITRDGRPGMTWAGRVVEDRAELVALYLPKETPHKRWAAGPSGRVLADSAWWANTLRLMFPGRSHSVWLTWRPDGDFVGYYVNLEEPFRRTQIGFDTNDHTLDIVVTPGLEWSWKDAQLLEDQGSRGDYSAGLIEAIRGEAASVIGTIESRGSPFTDGWEHWRPDPTWPTPRLADEWNSEPAALWERRLWAYPNASDAGRSESG
jgi:predicted RNA-binding protein associated with RNAse of E/G family